MKRIEKLLEKFQCGLADLSINQLSEKEKMLVFKTWVNRGYSKESASLIVYNNTYQYRLFK